MDCRWWFVSGLQEQGLIKIDFVRTKDNISNIGTKNVSRDVYDSFAKRLLRSRSEEGCRNDVHSVQQTDLMTKDPKESVQSSDKDHYNDDHNGPMKEDKDKKD